MKALTPLVLIAAAFAGGMKYEQAKTNEQADKNFHTTRALQGCELIASQTLHQVMEAEWQVQECKASQLVFLEALNKLGDELETTE
jgi:Tfp pilus assembly protein PilN